MNADLFQLSAPEVRVEERTFYSVYQPQRNAKGEVLRDPETGEVLLIPFKFRMRGCEEVYQQEVHEKAKGLIEAHVTGNKAKRIIAAPVLVPGGKPIKVSEGQCRIFAMAMYLNTPLDPQNEEEQLNLLKLAYFARVAKDAWEAFSWWVLDLFENPYQEPEYPAPAGDQPDTAGDGDAAKNGDGAALTPA